MCKERRGRKKERKERKERKEEIKKKGEKKRCATRRDARELLYTTLPRRDVYV